jgi:hypothetical protein
VGQSRSAAHARSMLRSAPYARIASALQHWWGLQRARLQDLCVPADRGSTCFCDGRWLAGCEGPMFSASSSASSASRAAAEHCALADLQAQSTKYVCHIHSRISKARIASVGRWAQQHPLGLLLDGLGLGHADQPEVLHQAADRLRLDRLSAAKGCCAADLRHRNVAPKAIAAGPPLLRCQAVTFPKGCKACNRYAYCVSAGQWL